MARKMVENESAISRPWEADGTGGQRIAIDIRRRGAARSLAGIRRINERASVSVQGRRSDTLAHDRFRVFGYQRIVIAVQRQRVGKSNVLYGFVQANQEIM